MGERKLMSEKKLVDERIMMVNDDSKKKLMYGGKFYDGRTRKVG
jgi:hypothetical protein